MKLYIIVIELSEVYGHCNALNAEIIACINSDIRVPSFAVLEKEFRYTESVKWIDAKKLWITSYAASK